jgi:hypothetical protein
MSGYSVAAPSALRQLRGLSGEQAYELWLDGGPSRWGSLSARNQARWETFARYLENHAITSINVTEKIIALLGGRAHPFDVAQVDDTAHRMGERSYTDAQIAEAAELFLHGALNVPDPDPVTGDASMFNVDAAFNLAGETKIAGQGHFITADVPKGSTVTLGNSWEELAGEVADEYTAKLADRATPDVAAAVDVLANALKAMLAPKG